MLYGRASGAFSCHGGCDPADLIAFLEMSSDVRTMRTAAHCGPPLLREITLDHFASYYAEWRELLDCTLQDDMQS